MCNMIGMSCSEAVCPIVANSCLGKCIPKPGLQKSVDMKLQSLVGEWKTSCSKIKEVINDILLFCCSEPSMLFTVGFLTTSSSIQPPYHRVVADNNVFVPFLCPPFFLNLPAYCPQTFLLLLWLYLVLVISANGISYCLFLVSRGDVLFSRLRFGSAHHL